MKNLEKYYEYTQQNRQGINPIQTPVIISCFHEQFLQMQKVHEVTKGSFILQCTKSKMEALNLKLV